MELNGKTAVVTGASTGIGLAIAEVFIATGATVHGLARNGNKLQGIKERLGPRFVPHVVDITDADVVARWASALAAPVHVLVNNAGIGLFKSLAGTTVEEWRSVQGVNVDGMFYVTRSVLPLLEAAGCVTHIVNIASVAGLMGNPDLSAYNASKFAVRGFSEALMKELRPKHVRVSCIYPGSVATAFFDKIGMSASAAALLPADVANAVRYVVEAPDHVLIDELVIRPRLPR